VEVTDFKVAPDWFVASMMERYDDRQTITVAKVVGLATVIRKESHCIFLRNVFGVLFNKLCDRTSQSLSTHQKVLNSLLVVSQSVGMVL
jgi:hypothetical protein